MKYLNKIIFGVLVLIAPLLLSSKSDFGLTSEYKSLKVNPPLEGTTYRFKHAWMKWEAKIETPIGSAGRNDDYNFYSDKNDESLKAKLKLVYSQEDKLTFVENAFLIPLDFNNEVTKCVCRNFRPPNKNVPILYSSDGSFQIQVGGGYYGVVIRGCASNPAYNEGDNSYGYEHLNTNKPGRWVTNENNAQQFMNNIAVFVSKDKSYRKAAIASENNPNKNVDFQ